MGYFVGIKYKKIRRELCSNFGGVFCWDKMRQELCSNFFGIKYNKNFTLIYIHTFAAFIPTYYYISFHFRSPPAPSKATADMTDSLDGSTPLSNRCTPRQLEVASTTAADSLSVRWYEPTVKHNAVYKLFLCGSSHLLHIYHCQHNCLPEL